MVATGLAKEFFDARDKYIQLFWQVFNKIDDEICPGGNIWDLNFDDYDNSIDFHGFRTGFVPTDEQLKAIRDLGFSVVYTDRVAYRERTACRECLRRDALSRPT